LQVYSAHKAPRTVPMQTCCNCLSCDLHGEKIEVRQRGHSRVCGRIRTFLRKVQVPGVGRVVSCLANGMSKRSISYVVLQHESGNELMQRPVRAFLSRSKKHHVPSISSFVPQACSTHIHAEIRHRHSHTRTYRHRCK
jgi:hypothetical protein